MTHQAAWIYSKGADVELGEAETPTPGKGELLVKVQAIAFSPIDWKQQKSVLSKLPTLLSSINQ
jgi:NADPH:quinone reductase-like Zn-dependent oxidoreductase